MALGNATDTGPVPQAPAQSTDQRSPRSRRGPVWLALAAVLALAAALRPQQLLSTLTSPRALLLLLGVVLLTLLLRRVTRPLPRPAASVLCALPGLLALLLLVLPTVRGTSVDEGLEGLEDLPGTAAPAAQSAADPAGAGGEGAPVRVLTAPVEGVGHSASGTASLVRLPDGALVVRLEDLEVDPGPDYRLVLVPGSGKESPGDAGQELGRLKATSGNQNYPLEQPVPDQPFTVLIWCEAFSVPIAHATLA